jgi:hypothetical protein
LTKLECIKYTYEAYKTMITMEVRLLQHWLRDYKIEKWKMLPKIKHLAEV